MKVLVTRDYVLTHRGRATHICVSKLSIIGSDNGLSPGGCQAIIWTNAGIWLIQTLGTNLSEILSENHRFSFKKMHLKMSSAKWRPFFLGLNVLSHGPYNGKQERWVITGRFPQDSSCILEIIDWNEILSSGIKHLIWLASLMFVQQCNKSADQNKAMTSDECRGDYKNAYELLNLRAFNMGKIFCVECPYNERCRFYSQCFWNAPGISIHQWFNCLFNNLGRSTWNRTPKPSITSPFVKETTSNL